VHEVPSSNLLLDGVADERIERSEDAISERANAARREVVPRPEQYFFRSPNREREDARLVGVDAKRRRRVAPQKQRRIGPVGGQSGQGVEPPNEASSPPPE